MKVIEVYGASQLCQPGTTKHQQIGKACEPAVGHVCVVLLPILLRETLYQLWSCVIFETQHAGLPAWLFKLTNFFVNLAVHPLLLPHQALQKDLLAAADAVERSFGEGQPVGLEDSKLSHPGHESAQARGTPAPHPGPYPEPLSRAQPEAGKPPAPGPGELGISGEAGDEQGKRTGNADPEAALGAALEAARPVTDLLDEVGTGRWQHAAPQGARLSPACDA